MNAQKEVTRLTAFIKRTFKCEGYTDALIGVSGGVDSATSLQLTVRALGKEHVHPVFLPYGVLNDVGKNDATKLCSFLQISQKLTVTVDIQPTVDSFCTWDTSIDEGRKGNVMARVRMLVLFDLSKKMNALVVGTENRTEHLLGYYTRFGDEASDIEPIRQFYKFEVYELARYLGVPDFILHKAPSAGLWHGQTDEGEFGFSYTDVDEVLTLHFDRHMTKEEIIRKGYDKKMIERMWWWIAKGSFKSRVPIEL